MIQKPAAGRFLFATEQQAPLERTGAQRYTCEFLSVFDNNDSAVIRPGTVPDAVHADCLPDNMGNARGVRRSEHRILCSLCCRQASCGTTGMAHSRVRPPARCRARSVRRGTGPSRLPSQNQEVVFQCHHLRCHARSLVRRSAGQPSDAASWRARTCFLRRAHSSRESATEGPNLPCTAPQPQPADVPPRTRYNRKSLLMTPSPETHGLGAFLPRLSHARASALQSHDGTYSADTIERQRKKESEPLTGSLNFIQCWTI